MRITLDAETFRALASPTRLAVLRALDERRKTLTEISRDLTLNKATVHEHLQLLSAAELVRKRDDEGRKWIYYELTWRGQKLLHPQETTTFNVLLGLGVAAAGGGLGLLARALYVALEPHAESALAPPEFSGEPQTVQRIAADTQVADQSTASPSETSAPASSPSPAAGAGASTATATSTSTAAPQHDMVLVGNDTAAAPPPQPADAAAHTSFLDDGGALGLALLAFAALMALFAWLLRRHLRADPFQPPSGPEE